jgi:sulfur-oxidizing protein SoxZ
VTLRALLHAPAQARVGELVEIRATAAHPMETGYRRSGEGQLLPRNLLRQLTATFEGQAVFSAEFHAAVSANPYVSFWMRVPGSGQLVVRWEADGGITHELRHELRATTQSG